MKKSDLIKAIKDIQGGTTDQITTMLSSIEAVAAGEIAEGRPFILPGVVKMAPKAQAARTARNPATGAAVEVPAKTIIKAKSLIKAA